MPARAASQRAGPSSRRHTQVEEDDDEGIVVSSDDELENIQPSAGPSTGRAGPSKGTQRQTQHKTPATTGGKRGRNSGAQTVPKSKNGKRARNESPPQHEQQAPEEDIPAGAFLPQPRTLATLLVSRGLAAQARVGRQARGQRGWAAR